MIQRLAASRPARFLGALSLLLLGCGTPHSASIPRTLAGQPVLGAFVPPSSYEAYVRGELLLAQGKTREAVAQLELATTAPDEDPYLLSRLAHAQLALGDREGAERTLRQAERLDGCSEALWLARGELHATRGEVDAARFAFERATACAPRSAEGELALARLLEQRGEQASALELMLRAAQRKHHASAGTRYEQALARAEPAVLAHALTGVGLDRALSSQAIRHGVRFALTRGLPRLALRLREQPAAQLSVREEVEVLRQNRRREELRSLVAIRTAEELGGHEQAAVIALEAGAYERAELEAAVASAQQPSDQVSALRVRALLALGRVKDASAAIAEIGSSGLRVALLAEALSALGAPKLGAELASHDPGSSKHQSAR